MDNEIVPRKQLVSQGSKGLGGVVGGTVLLILNSIAGGIPSLIVGGIIGLVGLAMSRSKDDKKAGLVIAIAGALTAISAIPAIGGVAGFLLVGSGVGLLLMGGWNLFKFIRGYRKRG
ncbi:MAG: hypothetical protein HN368_12655 [Spirochaetales bacterium]|jgi:hypothetical protein|nr:hypothetical protein [Spirochaetales bacterium]